MGLITQLFPSNYEAEKAIFWADPSYNPQFSYSAPIDANLLVTWGQPNLELEIPLRQLIQAHRYSPSRNPTVTTEHILQKVATFNSRLPTNDHLQVIFTDHMLSRSMIRGKTIYFRLPVSIDMNDFEALFLHEAESHYLRKVNHSHQSWNTHTFDEQDIRTTEEGLASLHTRFLTPTVCKPTIFLNYLAVLLASKYSFSKVYSELINLGLTPEKAWTTTFRTKRGLTNTAQPGGFTKDITYLKGIIEIWNAMINGDSRPQDFYRGRIPLHQLPTYRNLPLQTPLILPTIMDSIPNYLNTIATIGTSHHLAELAPYVI